ncbi:MAG TPA: formylglycine-generating enzyme family protein [Verrucomicrobiae bacterium]
MAAAIVAQEKVPSYLMASRLPETTATTLTILGYPGSTNLVQYANALDGLNPWIPLTKIVLTNSTLRVIDPTLLQGSQRFYRVQTLGATPLNVPGDFVWIPPGQFLMGSPVTEQDRDPTEGPQTFVTITRGFYMCNHLVTQGEYLALMGNNPSAFTGDTNRPVESTEWYGATNYCATLTQVEQSAGRLPATWCYRLPTEAEWEYACRAGTTTRFSYGDDPTYTQLPNYGWYDGNSYSTNKPPGGSYLVQGRYYTTHPVEQKMPNPWGLWDMIGEVSEWCLDWFAPYSGGTAVDPQGPVSGTERVVRGGSWLDDPDGCRSASRYGTEPETASSIYGFRVIIAPAQP